MTSATDRPESAQPMTYGTFGHAEFRRDPGIGYALGLEIGP